MDEAAAIARRTVPDGRLVSVTVPDDEPKSTYFAYLAEGFDPWGHGVYPGNVGVTIDRYSGKATITYPTQADPPLSAQIVDDWFYPLHAGTFVNGWWRVVWLVFGVTPVVLAITGIIDLADPQGQAAAQAAAGKARRGMSESLADTVALYAAGLALFSLVTAARGRGLGRAHAGAAVVLGAGAALGALIAVAAVATGQRPAEPIPFAGYLLLSVLAVPAGWRCRAPDDARLGRRDARAGGGRAVRHLRAARPDVGVSAGPPRLLGAVYVLFAIAAGARSAYQLATRFDDAPLAYGLSALAAAIYAVAALRAADGPPRPAGRRRERGARGRARRRAAHARRPRRLSGRDGVVELRPGLRLPPPRPPRRRPRLAAHRSASGPAPRGRGHCTGHERKETRMTSVAVDVGGTFTDVCVLDDDSGDIRVAKVPSTSDPLEGVLAGVEEAGIDLADVRLFSHGTTVATNALITRNFPPAAMVTTRQLPRRHRDPPRHPRRPLGRLQGRRSPLHPPPRPLRGDRARRLRGRGRRGARRGRRPRGRAASSRSARSRPSPSASSTPSPTRTTSGARPRSCARSSTASASPPPRRCCRRSSSTSASPPRWPTPCSRRSSAAT